MTCAPETSTTLLRDVASEADNARWEEFVARYRPMMRTYLAVHFPALEADDIVQETLAALVSVLPRYRYAPDETGHFRNYLTGILRNKTLKHCARRVRESAARSRCSPMRKAWGSRDSMARGRTAGSPISQWSSWSRSSCRRRIVPWPVSFSTSAPPSRRCIGAATSIATSSPPTSCGGDGDGTNEKERADGKQAAARATI